MSGFYVGLMIGVCIALALGGDPSFFGGIAVGATIMLVKHLVHVYRSGQVDDLP